MKRVRQMTVAIEHWPLLRPFVISRGAQTVTHVVVVSLTQDGVTGWGESTPYPRYGESPENVVSAIDSSREGIESDAAIDTAALGLRGAAANAVDCAAVDLRAKLSKTPAWRMLGLLRLDPLRTTATVVLGDPQTMAAHAMEWKDFSLIKVKLGAGEGDMDRIAAVRRARPDATLICDANEGWSVAQLSSFADPLKRAGVSMIEQPCKEGEDEGLRGLKYPIPICADESCHTAGDVEKLIGKYDLVNVKLDKAGGITGALALVAAAQKHKMGIMTGCMLGTSLAMAPGVLAGQAATYVDLDGPLALKQDRPHPLIFSGGKVAPASPALWG